MLRRLWWTSVRTWSHAGAYAVLAGLAGAMHLAEVHLLDARAADLARALTRWDFAAFRVADITLPAAALGLVAGYYLAVFLAFLAWTPGLVAATGDARLLKRTLLCYPLLYLLALPGFLFFPSVNPYVRAGAPSPFDPIHPELEELYYLLTTPDNTFPSLHVAFTLALAAALWRAWPAWRAVTLTHATLLVASVVVVRVHYVADAVAGAALAWIAWRIAGALLDTRLAQWLDAASERMALRRTRAWAAAEAWALKE